MRPTQLEVNLPRLRQNLENIRAFVSPAKVMVVLKANAYGHGVGGVAPFIAPHADFLGVALVEEGIHLREMGIETPVLVMGGTLSDQIPAFLKYGLTLTVSAVEGLEAAELAAAAANQGLRVHLKIDTGMERLGVHEYEAEPFIIKSASCRHLVIEGIYSHFANSELPDLTHASLQLERFHEVLSLYVRHGIPCPPIRHMANSGAILNFPESHLDLVRPGVLFYGVYPGRQTRRPVDVTPALTWRSRVVSSKMTRPGRPVSYGSLWQSDHPTRIVTIPCGYADGYFRQMTNKARVLIRGRRYPQVGRICMDQFMVDLGDDQAAIGEEVILLGEGIPVEDLADWTGTNEYEVMTSISARVPRVFSGVE